MNPIVFALRRPITVMMLVLALGLGGIFSIFRMQKDIFPSLNQPQLYVIHNYGGMDPKQIEGLITNVYELFFQYINNVEHVESRSIQSMVMLKLYFQPGTDMAEATAQTVAYCNRALSIMPVGSLPPYVVRLDAGSLPVGYLVFESQSRSVGELQDLALYRVRPMFSGLAGISSPPPFGGNIRTIVINVDPDRLRSYNLSPQDVVDAIDRGNYHQPLRQRHDQGPDDDRAVQHAWSSTHRSCATSRSSWGRTSISATSARWRTPPISPSVTRWSTAASRSTCRWSSRRRPRRSRSSTRSSRTCRGSRRRCPTT